MAVTPVVRTVPSSDERFVEWSCANDKEILAQVKNDVLGEWKGPFFVTNATFFQIDPIRVRRIFRKYKYPPVHQAQVVELVLLQAKGHCEDRS